MTRAPGRQRELRKASLLLALLTLFCLPTAGYATTCSALPELGVNKLQGAVYGPSGVSVPLILVQLSQEGKSIAETKTDGNGKFEFKTKSGLYDLQFLFLGSKSMDLKVRAGRGHGSLFHPARLRIVLGFSGTRCGFATTSSKEFKKALLRFSGQLQEKQH